MHPSFSSDRLEENVDETADGAVDREDHESRDKASWILGSVPSSAALAETSGSSQNSSQLICNQSELDGAVLAAVGAAVGVAAIGEHSRLSSCTAGQVVQKRWDEDGSLVAPTKHFSISFSSFRYD